MNTAATHLLPDETLKEFNENRSKLEQYETLRRQLGESPAGVALAWLLHNPIVTAPIIGPRTIEQLESTPRAADITLDEGPGAFGFAEPRRMVLSFCRGPGSTHAIKRCDVLFRAVDIQVPEYYPVSGQRAVMIRGSARVRYIRGSLLVNAKCLNSR